MKKKAANPFVIVRCRDAGVHAGVLVSNKGRTVELCDSIRIWYWSGAASLSELAVYGPKNKEACKFGVPVPKITLLGACEIIVCESAGESAIKGVKTWRA